VTIVLIVKNNGEMAIAADARVTLCETRPSERAFDLPRAGGETR